MSALVRKKFAWTDRALCKEVGGDLFISSREKDRLQVINVCSDCPVRQNCYDDAIEQKNTHGRTVVGVWGGVDFGQ